MVLLDQREVITRGRLRLVDRDRTYENPRLVSGLGDNDWGEREREKDRQ